VSEGALIAIFMAVWLAAALVPDLWLRKRLARGSAGPRLAWLGIPGAPSS